MPTLDNAHALIIGIANYRAVNALPVVVIKDAQDVYNVLTDPAICAYGAENVQLLLDEQATLSGMREALLGLAQRANTESSVFIYISSHGGRIEDGSEAGEYILPVDAAFSPIQGSLQLDSATALSGVELTEALRVIQARKVLVVLDLCHAGGVGQPKTSTPAAFKDGLPASYYEALSRGRGRAILAAARCEEYSYILEGAENSLFTKHLLAGLRGGAPSDDGHIRVFDLFEYVQPRVTADHPSQHPIFKAEVEENFSVALYRGGVKGTVDRDDQGFRYDAYISYVDRPPDSEWVWGVLVPQFEEAGLRVAVSGDVEEPGVARVVNIERGIRQSRRTVVVLSEAYLEDHTATFENVLAQTMDMQEGTYRLLPVHIEQVDAGRLPARLSMLTPVNLVHTQRSERELSRLLTALRGSLPHI